MPEVLGVPLKVPTNKKHGKTLVLIGATSPTGDGDYFPKKAPKPHTMNFVASISYPKEPPNARTTPTTTNEPLKETKKGNGGNRGERRAY